MDLTVGKPIVEERSGFWPFFAFAPVSFWGVETGSCFQLKLSDSVFILHSPLCNETVTDGISILYIRVEPDADRTVQKEMPH